MEFNFPEVDSVCFLNEDVSFVVPALNYSA